MTCPNLNNFEISVLVAVRGSLTHKDIGAIQPI